MMASVLSTTNASQKNDSSDIKSKAESHGSESFRLTVTSQWRDLSDGYYSCNGLIVAPFSSEGINWFVLKNTFNFHQDNLMRFIS